jgi:hypothetical protein
MHRFSFAYLRKWLYARLGTGRVPEPPPGVTRITHLFRNPAQLALLARRVHAACTDRTIRVAVWGVADGSEAISLLVHLNPHATGCTCRIDGFDISPELIARAEAGVYSGAHFPVARGLPAFANYLARDAANEDRWHLRDEWRGHLRYAVADVTRPPPPEQVQAYDLVLCQNVFPGWSPEGCRRGLDNLAATVTPGGWLTVGGGPLDVVPRHLLSLGFIPEMADARRIHEGWTIQREFYDCPKRPVWALEPFDAHHPDGAVRYCTIFRKPCT